MSESASIAVIPMPTESGPVLRTKVDYANTQRMPTLAVQSTPLGPLERYRIVAPLGKGGMAEVFLASWEVAPHVQRPVVIKRLYTHLGDDPQLVQMFIDEARLACGLEHENIVKTIEVGVIEGQCCIAMEYLAGQPLQQLLHQSKAQGGLAIPMAVHVAIQALDALHFAHEAVDHRGMPIEIVHRDISPQNIFITNSGQVKLLDFGIAKAKCHEGRTATGFIKGKLAYIAPEQAQAQPIDRRADIWSIGVVLWEMLTGTRLFRADTEAATLRATLVAPIAPPSKHRPDVRTTLDRIVLKALQRQVGLRYPTALAMKRDLVKLLIELQPIPDSTTLSKLMTQVFNEQITEQRRLIYNLLENGESFTMPTANTPGNAVTTQISSGTAAAPEVSQVDSILEQVTKNHKLVVRTLLGSLLLVLALGAVVVYVLAMRLGQAAGVKRIESKVAQVEAARAATPQHADVAASPSTPPSTDIRIPTETVTSIAPTATRSGMSSKNPTTDKAKFLRAKAAVEPPAAAVEYGYLSIDTTPWSLVSTGGKTLGQTPLLGVKIPVGTHVLTLRNPDLGITTQYSVTIENGKTLAKRIGLQ